MVKSPFTLYSGAMYVVWRRSLRWPQNLDSAARKAAGNL